MLYARDGGGEEWRRWQVFIPFIAELYGDQQRGLLVSKKKENTLNLKYFFCKQQTVVV